MIHTEQSHVTRHSGRHVTKMSSRHIGALLGAIGMVLWISTPLTYLLTGSLSGMVIGKMLLGTMCLAFYFATNGQVFREALGNRSTSIFAVSAGSTVILLLVLVMLNVLVARHPVEWDFTREGLYTLSEQTQSLIGRLQNPVEIKAFYASFDANFRPVHDVLERYTRASNGKINYVMVDPQSRPDLVEKYQITEGGPRIVMSQNGHDARVKEPTEQDMTHGLVKVAEQTAHKVYFLQGHGEGDITNSTSADGFKTFADAVTAEGYGVDSLNLQTLAAAQLGEKVLVNTNDTNQAHRTHSNELLQVPEDASALVILSPRHRLLDPELIAIRRYVGSGGRLVVFLEPHIETGLEPILADWRIQVNNDMVVDTNPLGRLLGLGAAAPVVQPSNEDHPIVKDLAAPAVMNTVRSLDIKEQGAPDITVVSLANTGESAWGETNLGQDGVAARDENDTPPLLHVAIAASRKPREAPPASATKEKDNKPERPIAKAGRLVVFGDGDWVSNRYLPMQGNQDLALNTLGWIVEQDQKITVRPKVRTASQLFLSNEQLGRLKFFSMDFLPVLMVATGLAVVLVRRQR